MNPSRLLLACAVLALCAGAVSAAEDLEIVRDGRGRTIALRNKAAPPARAVSAGALPSAAAKVFTVEAAMARGTALLAPHAAQFGVAAGELHAQGAHTDALRMSHVHYGQRHHGVPVFGSEVLVHANPDGALSTINGRTLPIAEGSVDPVPQLDADAAIEAAKLLAGQNAAAGAKPPEPQCCGGSLDDAAAKGLLESLKPPKLWLYNEAFLTNQSGATPTHLVWEVVLGAPGGKVSDTFFIDAIDSSLVKRSSNAQRLNRKVFDCTSYKTNGTCIMDLGSSAFYNFFIFGRSEGRPARGPNPVPGPAYGSTDVDKLHDLAGLIHGYYLSKFGRDGGNDHGGIGDGSASAPYGETKIFADLDGSSVVTSGQFTCPVGALYNVTNLWFCAFSFGDDVFAHEYGHAVANYKSFNTDGSYNTLFNHGESGALNESNSDITGEAFEYYKTGSNDWIFGTGSPYFGVRNYANPLMGFELTGYSYPLPDRYHHPEFYRGDDSYDRGGVHHNSCVPEKAAYLTAMGGTFNGTTIAGLGLAKVEQIWYRALTTYYANSETFNGAYVALRQACADLYPPADLAELTKALQAVELDQPPRPAPPFVITSIATASAGQAGATATLRWNSHAGKTYRVQYSTDLSTWTDVAPTVPAQGESTTYTDTAAAPNTTRLFYRIAQP